jgi:hypothetical protein
MPLPSVRLWPPDASLVVAVAGRFVYVPTVAEPRCTACGAPWRPTVAGVCSYCTGAGRPPELGPPLPPGELDARVLCLALIERSGSVDHPLDGVVDVLANALGERHLSAHTVDGHVTGFEATLGDRRFEAHLRGTEVEATDVHQVGGVVIRRQQLDHGGLLAELALLMAPLAARDPRLRAALIALPTP